MRETAFFLASGKWVHTCTGSRAGDKIMAPPEPTRLEEENRKLRKALAELRVHSEARKPNETLEQENSRLQEDLQWYQRLLKGD